MTADTKPLPPHGTTARAKGRPAGGIKSCHCRKCRNAENAYNKRRRVLRDTGRSLTINAAEAAEHLRGLLAANNGWQQTAEAAGMSISQLHDLVTGRQKTIGRARAERVLALKSTPVDYIIIDAVGTLRRIQALAAAGHRFADIAQASGLNKSVVSDLITGRVTCVRAATANAVRDAYAVMSLSFGTSVRNMNRARRERWADPAAWHGINMDALESFPDFTGRCGTPEGYQAHRSSGIPQCQPCKTAEAAASAERKARRAAAMRQGAAA